MADSGGTSNAYSRPTPVLDDCLLLDSSVLLKWGLSASSALPYTPLKSGSESYMEAVPWTVAAFKQRRRETWKLFDIGPLPASKQAAELLEKRGVIEIRQPMNQINAV